MAVGLLMANGRHVAKRVETEFNLVLEHAPILHHRGLGSSVKDRRNRNKNAKSGHAVWTISTFFKINTVNMWGDRRLPLLSAEKSDIRRDRFWAQERYTKFVWLKIYVLKKFGRKKVFARKKCRAGQFLCVSWPRRLMASAFQENSIASKGDLGILKLL